MFIFKKPKCLLGSKHRTQRDVWAPPHPLTIEEVRKFSAQYPESITMIKDGLTPDCAELFFKGATDSIGNQMVIQKSKAQYVGQDELDEIVVFYAQKIDEDGYDVLYSEYFYDADDLDDAIAVFIYRLKKPHHERTGLGGIPLSSKE